MTVQEQLELLIKEEITNDPEKLGYAGKTDQEIADLINNTYTKERLVVDSFPSRAAVLLRGLAELPNTISVETIISATKP